MRYTDEEIELAVERFEELAEKLDLESASVVSIKDLRGIGLLLRPSVKTTPGCGRPSRSPRAHGRSWNQIAVALVVSRQAARQRFADKVQT